MTTAVRNTRKTMPVPRHDDVVALVSDAGVLRCDRQVVAYYMIIAGSVSAHGRPGSCRYLRNRHCAGCARCDCVGQPGQADVARQTPGMTNLKGRAQHALALSTIMIAAIAPCRTMCSSPLCRTHAPPTLRVAVCIAATVHRRREYDACLRHVSGSATINSTDLAACTRAALKVPKITS